MPKKLLRLVFLYQIYLLLYQNILFIGGVRCNVAISRLSEGCLYLTIRINSLKSCSFTVIMQRFVRIFFKVDWLSVLQNLCGMDIRKVLLLG